MACELLTREFKTSAGESKMFACRELSASKALELHVELVGKLGTSVFPLIDNNYNFGDIIQVMQRGEHPVVVDLMKRVICHAAVEGQEIKPATFDIHFNGELMLSCHVFAFVLETNFRRFFKQGLEINEQRRLEAAATLAAEEQKSSSPKT